MSIERDIMARFIDLADRSLMPMNYQPGFLIRYRDDGTVAGTEPYPDDRIDPGIAKDYAATRAECLAHVQHSYQSAKTQEESAQKWIDQAIGFSGLPDPEERPKTWKLLKAMFVTFCDACTRAYSYQVALELERHPEAGQESTEG